MAVLENAVEINYRKPCLGCVSLENVPIEAESPPRYYNMTSLMSDLHESPERNKVDVLFWKELTQSMTDSCHCLTFKYQDRGSLYHYGSFEQKHGQHGCEECVVDMQTGSLRIETYVNIMQVGGRVPSPARCSLILLWKSKENSLNVPDNLLQTYRCVKSIKVYIDFMPALDLNKQMHFGRVVLCSESIDFIVPKICVVCKDMDGWRKSNCVAEADYIVRKMSQSHRQCYKTIKYILQLINDPYSRNIEQYRVKTAVFDHCRTCSNLPKETGKCALTILSEIQRSYNRKLDHLYQREPPTFLSVNELSNKINLYNIVLNELYSLSNNGSFNMRMFRNRLQLGLETVLDVWGHFTPDILRQNSC